MACRDEHASQLMELMMAQAVCQGRHTITGLLEVLGKTQQDWSWAYRLYRENVEEGVLFAPILDGILERLDAQHPLVVAVDDTYFQKTGQHTHGTGWYKDPLGPAFHTNLIQAQRFIQLSAAVPDPLDPKRARMIPIALGLIPKLSKPKDDASKEELADYEKRKAQNSPAAHALRLLRDLRAHLDRYPEHRQRLLWLCGDGDYSNSSLLPALPARCLYIGRTRGDVHLCEPADAKKGRGRPPSYGSQLPTPAQLRQDKSVPWQSVRIGQTLVHYKRIACAKWARAGEKALVQVLVVKPLRYKRHQNDSWHYKQPAYLVCTNASLPVEQLLQAYFWRWGIEVNFKETKQLFGVGQAQVRGPRSVQSAPSVCIAAYSALWLAAIRTYGFDQKTSSSLCPPKWYPQKVQRRLTCSDLLQEIRYHLLRFGISNFSGLASSSAFRQPPINSCAPLEPSATARIAS